MKADYLSYKRATSRSMLGLVIQLAMGSALLFYGIYGSDFAARAASAFVFAGLAVWVVLAITFDQHRRERVEAMEAEAFAASDAATSSVFEEGAQELRLAAKRLRFTHRFVVPAVGLALGLILTGVGLWLFRHGQGLVPPDEFARFKPSRRPMAALAIGLPIAFVGFVFARYIAGMAKQKVWTDLRGGASFAVGAALYGLALAAGHFIDIAGSDTILRYLQVVFPGAMVVIGGEILLNFVLELYRPRRAGEHPRPAFDSRILGFVAAPDLVARSIGEALSYQFGHDITNTWFYRLLSRSSWKLLVLGVGVLWAMSALVVIQPHQRGLKLRFGRVVGEPMGPGLHLKLPWPIDTVQIPVHLTFDEAGRVQSEIRTVTGVRRLNIGTLPPKPDTPILWTGEHALDERFLLVQPSRTAGSPAGAGLALAALVIECPLHYVVEDVEAFEALAPPEMRDRLLTAVAERELMQYVSTLSIADILSARRPEIGQEVRRRVTQAFAGLNPDASGKPRGAGVNVVFVGINGVHPPTSDNAMVPRAFEQVVTAEQNYQARLVDSRAHAVRVLTRAAGDAALAEEIVRELDSLESLRGSGAGEPAVVEQRLKVRDLIERAGGNAAVEISRASADRWLKHMGERSRLAAYLGQIESYTAAPALYRASLYLDALKGIMAESRVFIADPVPDLHLRQNMEDRDTGVDVFGSQPSTENP